MPSFLPKSRLDILLFSLYLFLFQFSSYNIRAIEAIKNIRNNVAFKNGEQRGLKPVDHFSLYVLVDGTVDNIRSGRLQTVISEINDANNRSIRQNFYGQSYAPNDNSNIWKICVQ